jgi:hypothetical protein
MSWTIAGKYVRASATDPDAQAYLQAVEAADGQALEFEVARAIDNFVLGCKADGIWSAIKASCILAGARTRIGALTPLVGTAPTSFNFVDGDYNRKTGLVGDGSSKYLNSNRNNNADPQNSFHASIWASSVSSTSAYYIAGDWLVGNTVGILNDPANTRERWGNRSSGIDQQTSNTHTSAGLKATSRSNSSTFSVRTNGATVTPTGGSLNSVSPISHNIYVFARNGTSGVPFAYANARLAFYAFGDIPIPSCTRGHGHLSTAAIVW